MSKLRRTVLSTCSLLPPAAIAHWPEAPEARGVPQCTRIAFPTTGAELCVSRSRRISRFTLRDVSLSECAQTPIYLCRAPTTPRQRDICRAARRRRRRAAAARREREARAQPKRRRGRISNSAMYGGRRILFSRRFIFVRGTQNSGGGGGGRPTHAQLQRTGRATAAPPLFLSALIKKSEQKALLLCARRRVRACASRRTYSTITSKQPRRNKT